MLRVHLRYSGELQPLVMQLEDPAVRVSLDPSKSFLFLDELPSKAWRFSWCDAWLSTKQLRSVDELRFTDGQLSLTYSDGKREDLGQAVRTAVRSDQRFVHLERRKTGWLLLWTCNLLPANAVIESLELVR